MVDVDNLPLDAPVTIPILPSSTRNEGALERLVEALRFGPGRHILIGTDLLGFCVNGIECENYMCCTS